MKREEYKAFQRECERLIETAVVFTTVVHEKCPSLKFDIYKMEDDSYYFNVDGDWYNDAWCKNTQVNPNGRKPLEACKEDALNTLNQMYKGTYYGGGDGGESKVFNTCTGYID